MSDGREGKHRRLGKLRHHLHRLSGEGDGKNCREYKKENPRNRKPFVKHVRLAYQRMVDILSRIRGEALLVERGKLVEGMSIVHKTLVEKGFWCEELPFRPVWG